MDNNILERITLAQKHQYLPSQNLHSLTDLTLLNLEASFDDYETLCQIATARQVATICVYPEAILLCRQMLPCAFNIATVANFPDGNLTEKSLRTEIETIVDLNPNEIDLVFPYSRYLAGEKVKAFALMQQCRDSIPNSILLKIILETGAFSTHKDIADISQQLIELNVDFLKTSTGKNFTGADPIKAAIILQTIASSSSNKMIGFKASGGIRTFEQANLYAHLTKLILNRELTSRCFRLGTSQLY
jgi:deoxyribose-phosphate aldolase